jgi:acyl-ACP thioesterase
MCCGVDLTELADVQPALELTDFTKRHALPHDLEAVTALAVHLFDTMTLEKQLDMEYLDRRIHIPEGEFTAHEAYQVTRNDIDYNHHVNNANYVRIVCEHIPADFQYTRMRIEFRLAVKFGETIRPESMMADGKLLFRLVTDAGVATLIEFS